MAVVEQPRRKTAEKKTESFLIIATNDESQTMKCNYTLPNTKVIVGHNTKLNIQTLHFNGLRRSDF